MRKSALLVLVFIMALSAFSIGAGDSESENEEVKEFIVKAVHYVVTAEGEVEVDDYGTDTTTIVIPKEVTFKDKTYKVKALAKKAFFQNKTLTSVTIESGITVIPEQAFMECRGLTELVIGDGIEKIGDSAFEGCKKLEEVTIPKAVKEMGKSVFKDCEGLKKIVFEGDLKKIDEDLFKNCDKLEEIEIQGDVELIDEKIFEGHMTLKSVKLNGNVDEIGKEAFKDCEKLEIFEFDKKKNVKKIGESAFEGCTSLEEIFIPGSLELIDKATFKGCEKLERIEIETGVEEIGESAFEGCSSVEEITIPSTVKKVGEMAFKDCIKLTTVELEEGVEEIGDSAFVGCGELKMVTIPASVKEIGESVFEGSSLEELTIPASMKVIKVSAFKNNVKLKKVTMEDGVEEIGDSAFVGCTDLEELSLPKTLKKIGEASFGGCLSLEELIIPDKVEKIGQSAFKDCEKIDSLLLGDGLKEIGDSAFMGCIALSTVVLPKDINKVDTATFKDCEVLDSLVLSEKLERINESAFEGCKMLPKVILPEKVAAIEKAAFKDCDSLKWVQVEFKEPFVIDLSVFEGIDEEAVLKVPKGTRSTFMKEESWAKQFAKIIGGEYKVTVMSTGFGEAVFKLDSLLAEPVDSLLKDSLLNDSLLTVRNDSLKLTYMEGDSLMVSFMSDKGYQIMDVTVNEQLITDSLFADIFASDTLSTEKPRFGEYTIAYLDQDYTVSVAYEKIHYRLTVTAIGKGTVSYLDESVEDTTAVFRIEDGLDAFVTFNPAEKWRIKSVTLDSLDITSEVPKYQYSIKNIKKHTTLVAEYEEIPINKYILTVYVSGKGEVAVDDNTIIRDDSWSAFFNEDTTAVLTFKPDEGYATKYLRVNGDDVTTKIVNNQYTIRSIRADINVNVSFAAVELSFSKDGVNYLVSSFADKKVYVTSADNVQTLEIPATVTYSDETWEVTGIKESALSECTDLAAVIWNPQAPFKAILSNPNALVYVKNEKYVAWADQNAIVDGTAKSITLTDGTKGNDFYCPKAFKAQEIAYTHNYSMETGITESKGWETIALPFDVQTISHASAGTIQPFKTWSSESEAKPFWLYELTAGGYQEAEGIKANTPYIISLPNNSLYLKDYRIVGKVTFGAKDVEVKATKDLNTIHYSDRTFVPNFTNKEEESILALNVNNDLVRYTSSDMGSRFIKGLRKVYPFEAYMTTTSNTRTIGILEDMTTAIKTVQSMFDEKSQGIRVYDLRGVLVKSAASMKDIKSGLKAGVYVIQGKKMIIQ